MAEDRRDTARPSTAATSEADKGSPEAGASQTPNVPAAAPSQPVETGSDSPSSPPPPGENASGPLNSHPPPGQGASDPPSSPPPHGDSASESPSSPSPPGEGASEPPSAPASSDTAIPSSLYMDALNNVPSKHPPTEEGPVPLGFNQNFNLNVPAAQGAANSEELPVSPTGSTPEGPPVPPALNFEGSAQQPAPAATQQAPVGPEEEEEEEEEEFLEENLRLRRADELISLAREELNLESDNSERLYSYRFRYTKAMDRHYVPLMNLMNRYKGRSLTELVLGDNRDHRLQEAARLRYPNLNPEQARKLTQRDALIARAKEREVIVPRHSAGAPRSERRDMYYDTVLPHYPNPFPLTGNGHVPGVDNPAREAYNFRKMASSPGGASDNSPTTPITEDPDKISKAPKPPPGQQPNAHLDKKPDTRVKNDLGVMEDGPPLNASANTASRADGEQAPQTANQKTGAEEPDAEEPRARKRSLWFHFVTLFPTKKVSTNAPLLGEHLDENDMDEVIKAAKNAANGENVYIPEAAARLAGHRGLGLDDSMRQRRRLRKGKLTDTCPLGTWNATARNLWDEVGLWNQDLGSWQPGWEVGSNFESVRAMHVIWDDSCRHTTHGLPHWPDFNGKLTPRQNRVRVLETAYERIRVYSQGYKGDLDENNPRHHRYIKQLRKDNAAVETIRALLQQERECRSPPTMIAYDNEFDRVENRVRFLEHAIELMCYRHMLKYVYLPDNKMRFIEDERHLDCSLLQLRQTYLARDIPIARDREVIGLPILADPSLDSGITRYISDPPVDSPFQPVNDPLGPDFNPDHRHYGRPPGPYRNTRSIAPAQPRPLPAVIANAQTKRKRQASTTPRSPAPRVPTPPRTQEEVRFRQLYPHAPFPRSRGGRSRLPSHASGSEAKTSYIENWRRFASRGFEDNLGQGFSGGLAGGPWRHGHGHGHGHGTGGGAGPAI
ncbi:hypothetical protein K402DRAFT_425357 [Aulographum hederae CBS 113979]|uniref:Uncharacterized protein n=1 Tax=Aulographum hederae CBS 113979 TaxID=1176131 RepID=A0A6G1GL05_9PEZI|nr:hypothetical protein K402DRAFT_425357 [Aulographum hederae CBS 113979]